MDSSACPRGCIAKPSFGDKARWSLISGALFFLIASPWAFQLTNMLTKKISPGLNTLNATTGKPTWVGVGIHALLFFLVVFIIMLI